MCIVIKYNVLKDHSSFEMLIDIDELHIIIYRYLLEQGYEHTAFAFHNEAQIKTGSFNPS